MCNPSSGLRGQERGSYIFVPLGRFITLSKLGKIELISAAAAEVVRYQRTHNILYNWFGTATAPVGLKAQNHCLRMQARVKK